MARCRLVFGLIALIVALSVSRASAFSVAKEINTGKQASAEVLKDMPLSKNEAWQHDIAEMGKRIASHVQRKEIPYEFRVVKPKDDDLNAFALPGGYVFFTERMWRTMTPDERASIMAHEITHCDRRHGIDMMLKSQQRALWMLPLIVVSGGAAQAILWGNMVINQRYSRKMEREADEYGVKLCAAAGYNPAAAVTAMKKLLYMESSSNRYEVSAIFLDHPETQKRIEYLTQSAAALGAEKADMELMAVADPSRLGNVTARFNDLANLVSAHSTVALERNQKVLIKKMLWDDDAKALVPTTIATAITLSPGRFPMLIVSVKDAYATGDVMAGDGIYPMPPEAPPTPTP